MCLFVCSLLWASRCCLASVMVVIPLYVRTVLQECPAILKKTAEGLADAHHREDFSAQQQAETKYEQKPLAASTVRPRQANNWSRQHLEGTSGSMEASVTLDWEDSGYNTELQSKHTSAPALERQPAPATALFRAKPHMWWKTCASCLVTPGNNSMSLILTDCEPRKIISWPSTSWGYVNYAIKYVLQLICPTVH